MNLPARSRIAAVSSAMLLLVLIAAWWVHGRRGDAAAAGRSGAGSIVVPEPPSGRRIRVEVLNAAGRSGLAREATRRLRERGFDVVFFGNAEEFGRDTSVVLDRVADPDAAGDVAAALGIARVRSEPDAELLLEVTVVLGLDWPPPARPATGLGDRLRRLLRMGGAARR